MNFQGFQSSLLIQQELWIQILHEFKHSTELDILTVDKFLVNIFNFSVFCTIYFVTMQHDWDLHLLIHYFCKTNSVKNISRLTICFTQCSISCCVRKLLVSFLKLGNDFGTFWRMVDEECNLYGKLQIEWGRGIAMSF